MLFRSLRLKHKLNQLKSTVYDVSTQPWSEWRAIFFFQSNVKPFMIEQDYREFCGAVEEWCMITDPYRLIYGNGIAYDMQYAKGEYALVLSALVAYMEHNFPYLHGLHVKHTLQSAIGNEYI